MFKAKFTPSKKCDIRYVFYKATISNHEKSLSSHKIRCKLSFALTELFLRKNFVTYGRGKVNLLISVNLKSKSN